MMMADISVRNDVLMGCCYPCDIHTAAFQEKENDLQQQQRQHGNGHKNV